MSDLPLLLVETLLKPETYPHAPEKVEFVQTHMSLVFLCGDLVYKVKKTINLGYVDYTSLERRKFFCDQELRLNRRFGSDVYLEVLPITRNGAKIAIGGQGEIIDYAVKMRRLPQERMMDVMLEKGEVTPEMIDDLAARVATFHRLAEGGPHTSQFGSLEVIRTNTAENFAQTEKYFGQSISETQFQRLKSYTEGFIARNAGLFKRRVRDGKIRDLHGDLHVAHICFAREICIYDCIEFNERFRYADVAAEVSFLAMDLDFHGRPDLAQRFVDAYVRTSGDRELPLLLNFYKCYYAYVRGKVASFKLDDPLVPPEEKARMCEMAQGYFKLAESYTQDQRPAASEVTGGINEGTI